MSLFGRREFECVYAGPDYFGAELPPQFSDQPAVAQAPAYPNNHQMKVFCQECGALAVPTDEFCKECGAALSAPETAKRERDSIMEDVYAGPDEM